MGLNLTFTTDSRNMLRNVTVPKFQNKAEAIRIGKKLRQLRHGRDMSLIAVSELLDISYQQLQKYESGKNVPSIVAMKLLARALKVDPCEICGCRDESKYG